MKLGNFFLVISIISALALYFLFSWNWTEISEVDNDVCKADMLTLLYRL